MALVRNLIRGLIAATALTVVIGDGVLVGGVVSVKNDGAGLGKQLIGISHTIGSRAAGYVVPSNELIAGLGGGGQLDLVAHGLVLGGNIATATGVEGHSMCINLNNSPVRGDSAIHKADLDGVYAGLGQHDAGRGSAVGDLQHSTVVDLDLISGGTDHGNPCKGALCILGLAAPLVVTSVHNVAPNRSGCANGAYADGVLRALDPVQSSRQVKAVGGYLILGGADLYLILLGTGHGGPAEGGTDHTEIGGGCKNGLADGQLTCSRSSITGGLGVNLDHNVALTVLQADRGHGTIVHQHMVVRGVAALHGYHVVSSVCNLVPEYGLGSIVKTKALDCSKALAVDELTGGGGSIAIGYGSHGEANAAGGHHTVGKVVGNGCTVIKIGVLVVGVAAHNGDQVLLGILYGIEQQRGVDYLKCGNLAQCLIGEVTNRLGIVGIACVSKSNHLDLILAGCKVCKGDVQSVAGHRLVDHHGTIGGRYGDLIGSGTADGLPVDAVGRDRHHRSGQLAAGGGSLPQSIQGGIAVQGGSLLITVGELLAVVGHTDPPALELKAIALKRGQLEQFAAAGQLVGRVLAVLVVGIKAHRILGTVQRILAPTGIEGHVAGYGLCVKCESSGLEFAVCIPANEYIALAGGISGSCKGLAVQHRLGLNAAAAIGLKADGVGDLLEEAHGGALIGQGHNVVSQGGGDGFLSFGGKVQGQRTVGQGVRAGCGLALYGQSKAIALTQRQGVFLHTCVKVIGADLGTCCLRAAVVGRGLLIGTTLHQKHGYHAKHKYQSDCCHDS